MKKGISILALLAVVTAGAFAQNVSLDMRLSRYGNGNDIIIGEMMEVGSGLSLPNFIPGIGVAIDVGSVEILAEVEFWRIGQNIEDTWEESGNIYDVDLSVALSYFSISAGVAPVVRATDSFTLTFPIMLTYSHFRVRMDEDDFEMRIGINSFGINLGTRLFYSLTSRWSVFAGVQVAAFTFFGEPTISAEWPGGSDSEDIPITSTVFFHNGRVDLGVRLHF